MCTSNIVLEGHDVGVEVGWTLKCGGGFETETLI